MFLHVCVLRSINGEHMGRVTFINNEFRVHGQLNKVCRLDWKNNSWRNFNWNLLDNTRENIQSLPPMCSYDIIVSKSPI